MNCVECIKRSAKEKKKMKWMEKSCNKIKDQTEYQTVCRVSFALRVLTFLAISTFYRITISRTENLNAFKEKWEKEIKQ